MIDQGKKNLLGIWIDAVDYEAAISKIIAAAHRAEPMSVSALAVHGVMTGVLDQTHRHRLNHLDLVVADGQPVRWAINLLYHVGLPDRVYGPTLMLRICECAAEDGLPIFLYGSRPAVIERLCSNLRSRFHSLIIAGSQPSRFRRITSEEKQEIVQDILSNGAAITFVGLGAPRQEIWVYEYREALSMPLLAVGAAFDFHADTLPQAPPRLQRLGLEWLFRLTKEPRRLWKRYVLLNPLYMLLVLLQTIRLARFDPATTTPPKRELRYG